MAKKTNLGTFTIVKQDEDVIISVKAGESSGSSFLPANYSIDDLASKVALLIKNVNVAKSTKNKLTIDLVKEIIIADGKIVPLLAKEIKLLRYFSENVGKIISREELLENVWKRERDSTTRTLDVHISRLRQKMGDMTDAPSVIQTIHGKGYKFVPPAHFIY
ncbi:MAG: winged helix-turn-helix transcriptional regulator [Spirochaetaceae bacterium]|nr:winged helix-turn-helix transcriptional regulator [Spirochaetaceae bacterium]MBO4704570.1 winged helix-turn-helix transcriptional regulator [Spirochaetaceae bacterium]